MDFIPHTAMTASKPLHATVGQFLPQNVMMSLVLIFEKSLVSNNVWNIARQVVKVGSLLMRAATLVQLLDSVRILAFPCMDWASSAITVTQTAFANQERIASEVG